MSFFSDWETHKKEHISKTILWEYDTESPRWDWNRMAETVVRRVRKYGREEDYYAMLQLYGGFGNVGEIVRRIPKLHRREICWACALFKLKEEELLCCRREEKRKRVLGFKERFRAKNTLKGDIGDIFIDCIRYDYPLVRPLVEEEGVRLASLEDVCCMKLAAITDDGTRLKDFVDIAYLSARFSLGEMLGWYQEKYGDVSTMQPLKALLYYDDIDFDGEPVELINGDFSWEAVKGRLQLMTKNPGKVFASFPLPQPRRRERGGIER